MTENQKHYQLHNSRKGHSGFQVTHGLHGVPEYYVWNQMKNRCLNKNTKKYPTYGGRGIRVCDRWMDFGNFISDMGRRPSPKHSIERMDNNGDYCPENCRWAINKEQCRNKRNNRIIEIDGEKKCAKAWADQSSISYGTIMARLNRGWNPRDAVFRAI